LDEQKLKHGGFVQENGFSLAKLERTLLIMMQDKKSYLKTIVVIPKHQTLCLNLKIKFETLKFKLENPKPNFPDPYI
jgi:predicted sugar kinase